MFWSFKMKTDEKGANSLLPSLLINIFGLYLCKQNRSKYYEKIEDNLIIS